MNYYILYNMQLLVTLLTSMIVAFIGNSIVYVYTNSVLIYAGK